MPRTDSWGGRTALCAAHCAGLVDLTALPLWVSALVQHYRFDSQQAGALVTLFLIGGVLASVAVAPWFHRLATGRWLALTGFSTAAVVFHLMADTSGFGAMALLHAVGGAAVGIALSMTHGTVARSANPHRLFAICGMAQGVFALVVMASVPAVMIKSGSWIVFEFFAIVSAVGAVAALAMFPPPNAVVGAPSSAQGGVVRRPIPRAVWGGVLGLCCMSLVQSMSFAFLERAGADRGFSAAQVAAVLVALGIVNLFPSAIAALMERRIAARSVLIAGPIAQALLSATVFNATSYTPYALAGSLLVATILFSHVFGFGLLARLDVSGRVLAATPAMMMTGAAIGPVLGGTLIKSVGYPAVGIAACVVGGIAVACFACLPRLPRPATRPTHPQAVH